MKELRDLIERYLTNPTFELKREGLVRTESLMKDGALTLWQVDLILRIFR